MTPYRVVRDTIDSTDRGIEGHIAREALTDASNRRILRPGIPVSAGVASKVRRLDPPRELQVLRHASSDVVYLTAEQEGRVAIGQATTLLNDAGEFLENTVETRLGEQVTLAAPDEVDYLDVAPQQVFSPSALCVPFLQHNDSNRALMGANMQRQAVPLLRPEAPIVATGMEEVVAQNSGCSVLARSPGTVVMATSTEVHLQAASGLETYEVSTQGRSSADSMVRQRVAVEVGDVVQEGDVLADGYAIEAGELALGQNVLVAYVCYQGSNYEDSIVVSERLMRDDKFTSTSVKVKQMEARISTDSVGERVTPDIHEYLDWAAAEGAQHEIAHLDPRGVASDGSVIEPGGILVGFVVRRDEIIEAAEMLRAKELGIVPGWRDACMKAKISAPARVIRTEMIVRTGDTRRAHKFASREVVTEETETNEGAWEARQRVVDRPTTQTLAAGIQTRIRVWIAQTRRLQVGDKMSGRHGNKGLVSLVLPQEEMPYLADGTPVDVLLTPLGVPSRMNMGQLMEAHLGLGAQRAGVAVRTPAFDSASYDDIQDTLGEAWFIEQAKAVRAEAGQGPDMERVRAWMEERGMDYDGVFATGKPGTAARECLREWLRDRGQKVDELAEDDLSKLGRHFEIELNDPPPTTGKAILYDGRTGEPFERPVTVGYKYMLKLAHMVADKLHARSTGGYSSITRQPMGGKAAGGGQRLGEMEVWALEGHSAAYTLQEMLTLKSDDRRAGTALHSLIRRGSSDGVHLGDTVPESFSALLQELGALGLRVESGHLSDQGDIWSDPQEAGMPGMLPAPVAGDEAAG